MVNCICICKGATLNLNLKEVEYDETQHDRPAAHVTAYQSYSTTFFSLCFHSHKQNSVHI
jgi:hypothetical protein